MTRVLRALRRSLFARLVLIFLATALAFGVLDNAAELLVDRERPYQRLIGAHLSRYVDYLLQDLGMPPDPGRARALTESVPLDIRLNGPGVDWSSHSKVPRAADLTFDRHGHARQWRRSFRRFVHRRVGEYSVVFATPPFGYRVEHNVAGSFMLLGSLAILFLCYLAVRRLFSPIRLLHDGVQRIGAGELDYRVPVRRRDELGELADAVNAMAADVGQMLESKRELLLAISHELRSPITRARLALELIDADDKRALGDDLDEMERIVQALLEGERLGSRHAVLNRTAVALPALLRSLVEEEFGGSQERLALRLPGDYPTAQLDATRVRLALRNLIDNALRHGGTAPVTVELTSDADVLRARVTDRGPGIDAGHVAHLGEPFFRADPSRDRDSGGIGLGLYLCRRIAEAHGGALDIDNTPGKGTSVTLRLPRDRAAHNRDR